jgi:hypothetical protein
MAIKEILNLFAYDNYTLGGIPTRSKNKYQKMADDKPSVQVKYKRRSPVDQMFKVVRKTDGLHLVRL